MARRWSRVETLRLRLVAAAFARRITVRLLYALGASLLLWQALSLLTLAIPFTAIAILWIEVGISSLCSLVLLLPLDPEGLRRDLRRVDPHSLLEALEEALPGAARSFLERHLQRALARPGAMQDAVFGLLAKKSSVENRRLVRATLRFLALSALIQAVALTASGSLVFAPREARDGTQAGIRLSVPGMGAAGEDEETVPGIASTRRREPSRREEREASGEDEAADSIQRRSDSEARPGPRSDTDAGEARRRDEAAPNHSGMPTGRSAGVSGAAGSTLDADASPDDGPQNAPGEAAPPGSGSDTEAGTGGKGERQAPAAPSPGGMPGWQKTPDTKVPSPLLDYHTRLERVLASTRGKSASASGALAAGEAESDPVREVAAASRSFRLPTGAQAAWDPYADFLRSRWARRRQGLP